MGLATASPVLHRITPQKRSSSSSALIKIVKDSIVGWVDNSSGNSMSQGLGHQGIYIFSDGFDAPTTSATSQGDRHQQHQHQGAEDEHGAVYEGAAGAGNMLSEMFNFPNAVPAGPMVGFGNAAANAGDWYNIGNRPEGIMMLGGSSGSLGSIGDHAKQQLNADSTVAAMQLFLMNPQQQQQQQQEVRSPSPPPQTHQALIHHASAAAGPFGGHHDIQATSLSLSSSLQQFEMAKVAAAAAASDHHQELRVRDGVLYFNAIGGTNCDQNPSSSLHLGMGYGGHPAAAAAAAVGGVTVLRNSKYSRPAQELLEEFCSVGRGQLIRGSKSSWHHGSSSSNPNAASTAAAAGGASPSKDAPPALTPADRFEHQRNKSKLLSMLDEVDRRYNHYCDRMQMVVNSFDSAVGFGAANPYTALAQKAMSRHFRCLKDAIAAQLKRTCELLGDKDHAGGTGSGITKGETPRLRVLDRSLRQQRAFHQMGMTQQEAWRPQRGLPERSVNVLRAWLFEHFLHPYPSDADKHLLARQTGLSRGQVSNWFINARVRLWKPMVEEMYQQEAKDAAEGSQSTAAYIGPAAAAAAGASRQPSQSASPCHQNQQQLQCNPRVVATDASDIFPSSGNAQMLQSGTTAGAVAVCISSGNEPSNPMLDSCTPDQLCVPTEDIYREHGATGDVSLTLGLRHPGNASIRDFGGC